METIQKPLILVTNDDGIGSPGLWAAVEAVLPLGEVLVVAPDRQWSGAGRAMPHQVTGELFRGDRIIANQWIEAWAVDASPALAVAHGLLELVSRPPALVVSGINAGANISTDITISGTVGAALEAGAFGIPALAVSLEMAHPDFASEAARADYRAAQAFTCTFAGYLLNETLPFGIDVLNVNIPSNATPETGWQFATLSRQRYFIPLPPERKNGPTRPGYRLQDDPWTAEPDSDIRILLGHRMVSVTPLSLDLTALTLFESLLEMRV